VDRRPSSRSRGVPLWDPDEHARRPRSDDRVCRRGLHRRARDCDLSRRLHRPCSTAPCLVPARGEEWSFSAQVPRLARPPRFRPAPQPSAGSCARPPPPHLRAATSRVPRLTAQSNAAQHDDGGASIWLWCRAQRALLAPGRRRPAPRPLESAPRAHGPRVPPTRSCRTCAVCPCVCGYNTMSVIHGLRTAYLRPPRTLVARALHTPRCARPSAPRSPPRQRLPAARNPPARAIASNRESRRLWSFGDPPKNRPRFSLREASTPIYLCAISPKQIPSRPSGAGVSTPSLTCDKSRVRISHSPAGTPLACLRLAPARALSAVSSRFSFSFLAIF
jgi:hypothetical protein